jgi:hypothetical protein
MFNMAWNRSSALLGVLALGFGLAWPAHAEYYDRYDRQQRVLRGERLEWNTLDDFRGVPADDAGDGSTVYSWAACLQMCFALAGYQASQADLVTQQFGRDPRGWASFNARSLPTGAHLPGGSRGADVYFTMSTLVGRLSAEDAIHCIDHGSPVVLIVDPGLDRRGGDPLTEYRRGGPRLALLHGYAWQTQGGVRTLWVDVYDPLPPDGTSAGTVRLPYNQLARAWAGTLHGTLVDATTRLGISHP